jgi:hypothetical protein
MGCDVAKVYKDHGVSGAKGRDNAQPSMRCVVLRHVGNSTWSWPGRSIGLAGACKTSLASYPSCTPCGSTFTCISRGLDTRTPAGKAMFQMMGVFAEFERAMIQERVRAGLARAKSEGKRLGRPRIAPELEARIRKALATPGRPGVRKIATQFGVAPDRPRFRDRQGPPPLYRLLRRLEHRAHLRDARRSRQSALVLVASPLPSGHFGKGQGTVSEELGRCERRGRSWKETLAPRSSLACLVRQPYR